MIIHGVKIIGHPGNYLGYSAALFTYPEENLAVIVLANCSEIDAPEMANKVAALYLPERSDADPESNDKAGMPGATLSPKQMGNLAGKYTNQNTGVTRTLIIKQDSLTLQLPNRDLKLIYIGENAFINNDLHFKLKLEFATFQESGKNSFSMFINDKLSAEFRPFQLFEPGPELLEQYIGGFHSEEVGAVHSLKLSDSSLILEFGHSDPVKLNPIARDFFAGRSIQIRFIRNAEGKVTGYSLSYYSLKGVRFSRIDEIRTE